MNQVVAIAAGGAIGALLRFWVASGVYAWLGRGFPWGTLVVNVAGSLAIGLFYVLLVERLALGGEWRAFIIVGILGAFTTFSTFSLETLALVEEGQLLRAGLNIVVSVVACLAAAWLGIVAGRQL